MNHLIPQVHLVVALDSHLAPGPILQALDYLRVKNWQQETILICDSSWRSFLHEDQPALFLDQSRFYRNHDTKAGIVDTSYVDEILEQLDSFEITEVTQLGSLSWGRWLNAYIESLEEIKLKVIEVPKSAQSSVDWLNIIVSHLGLDLSMPMTEKNRSSEVYIDPYDGEQLSSEFMDIARGYAGMNWPDWLFIVAKKEDASALSPLCGEDHLIYEEDLEVSLHHQNILCFSDRSRWAQRSRSHNIALYKASSESSLFLQGDISISTEESIHLAELTNILSYWKAGRLKELAFQWYNMGVDIDMIELFQRRLVRRNLLTYSTDLFNCQKLVSHFNSGVTASSHFEIRQMVSFLKNQTINDPFALCYSLKMLIMIAERMLVSANCGERLFSRLGSDFHRIVIGESLIEGVLEKSQSGGRQVDVKQSLSEFLKYLVQVDFMNDQDESVVYSKES